MCVMESKQKPGCSYNLEFFFIKMDGNLKQYEHE